MEKVDYLRLRTLADVKAERVRVGDRLDRVKDRLQRDYDEVARMFDFNYVIEAVAERISRIYGIIQTVLSGFDIVRSLVGKFRAPSRGEEDPARDR